MVAGRSGSGPRLSRPSGRTVATAAALVAAWLALAVPVTVVVFANSARATVVAGHDAVIRPNFDGWAQIDLGPVLPSFRYPVGGRIGADIALGKTTLTSYDALVERYAFLASQPESQIAKVEDAVVSMARDSALAGLVAGLATPGLWLLLGRRRRRELWSDRHARVFLVVGGVTAVVVVAGIVIRPWLVRERYDESTWQPLASALPDVRVPAEAQPLQVDASLLTQGTRRLVESALSSYRTSSQFYNAAAEQAADLVLRSPEEGDTVALMVSDRHDNIGMDLVARAIGDAGGASFLLDAGDDTSTGSSWESFSLESLDRAFDDVADRFLVAGNHDFGTFLPAQAERLGFTMLDGQVVDGPDGIRLLGVPDPRSSGLGNWRDETGLSFSEVADRLADLACEAEADGARISTVLVHDRNLGRPALERGCTDLVLSGHLHVVVGPDRVVGENGRVGWTFTTGTTGGAAYAIAVGTKPRRDATVSLVTYRDGRPLGIQTVRLSPLGDFTVGAWTPLDLTEEAIGPADGEIGSPEGTRGEPTPDPEPVAPAPDAEPAAEPAAEPSG